MRIYSITRGEWVNGTPDVDSHTNRIVGYTVEGQSTIEPPQLFFLPPPIDWERVRIQAAINVLSGLVQTMRGTAESDVKNAVELAKKLTEELQNKNKQ